MDHTSSLPDNRAQTWQRVVTALLSSLFVLLFLLLLDNLLLQQLKQRAVDDAMAQMQSVQRMNYQGMLQWFGHQQRHLAFWLGSPTLRAMHDATDLPPAARAQGLAAAFGRAVQTHPELRDVLIIDRDGIIVLATDAAIIGQPSPLAADMRHIAQLRRGETTVTSLFVVTQGAQREHRLLLAAPLDTTLTRFVALSLSPDEMYLRGPAAADRKVMNYLVDEDRQLHRFDRANVLGPVSFELGGESWHRFSGIAWPPIRHLKLAAGDVEWREPYLGVSGEQVVGLWSWQPGLGLGLLSEMKIDDALLFYDGARRWVMLITTIIAGLFAVALLVSTVLHVRLFGAHAPGAVLRFWLRLWPWPWIVTMLGFAVVVTIMLVLGLGDMTVRSRQLAHHQLQSAQDMTLRALTVWHQLELANARLWAASTRVDEVVRTLQGADCRRARQPCAAHAALGQRLAPLVRSGDHQGYAVVAGDGRVLTASVDLDAALGRLLAAQPQLLQRARAEGALISPIVTSLQPQPGVRGEYSPGGPLLYVLAPVGNSETYLVLQLNPRAGLFGSVEVSRFGGSGESYLVDTQGRIASYPRLQRSHPSTYIAGVTTLPPGPVLEAAQARRGGGAMQAYRDYRGVAVIGQWFHVEAFDALLVTEIDDAEAMMPLRSIRLALLLVAVVGVTAFVSSLLAQYLALRERLQLRVEGVQLRSDVWSRWGNHPHLMTAAVALGAFVIEVAILALMSWFELGDARVRWFATAAMFTALLLPFIHLLILKPATHANLLLSQLLSRSAEQEERYRRISEELAHANTELQRIAAVDQLTGIANRRHLDTVLQYEIDRCQRSQQPLAVLLLDVDHFKPYNDNYGHPAGDLVLQKLGAVLRQCVTRSTDLVARYGGEEFCMVLPNTSDEHAVRKAEEIIAAVETLALPHAFSPVADHVTVSIGVFAAVPGLQDTPPSFYQRADRALYRAKHAGRNQVQLAVTE